MSKCTPFFNCFRKFQKNFFFIYFTRSSPTFYSFSSHVSPVWHSSLMDTKMILRDFVVFRKSSGCCLFLPTAFLSDLFFYIVSFVRPSTIISVHFYRRFISTSPFNYQQISTIEFFQRLFFIYPDGRGLHSPPHHRESVVYVAWVTLLRQYFSTFSLLRWGWTTSSRKQNFTLVLIFWTL